MRHRKNVPTLDRKKAAREALLRNLAQSIVLYEKVQTTRAKAHAVQPLVERMVTWGKENSLAARRHVGQYMYHQNAVRKVLEVLAPRYKARHGGYTRITRLGQRQGDGAEMVQIEFV
ncbi:50S ribosomal protein L17 [Candidatus Uhrbacteria bacterium]|nr:50S ribosomal protein L17 [Candidatus Uhrbacteria bacterium]